MYIYPCVHTHTHTRTFKVTSAHAFAVTCIGVTHANQLGRIHPRTTGAARLTHVHVQTNKQTNKHSHMLVVHNTHCYKELHTHMQLQTCTPSFVTSLVPQKVILHQRYLLLLPTPRSSMMAGACQLKNARGSLAIPNVVYSK